MSLPGAIVWINRPFKCGSYPGYKSFSHDMALHLDSNEAVVADNGCTGQKCLLGNSLAIEDLLLPQCIHARHDVMRQ